MASLFDLSGVVAGLANESVSFRRQTKTLDASGVYSNSEATIDTVNCSIQPIEGKKAQAELELIQSSSGVSVWAPLDLRVGEPGGEPGDRFTWDGDTYEIRARKSWQTMGAFREYLAGKIE